MTVPRETFIALGPLVLGARNCSMCVWAEVLVELFGVPPLMLGPACENPANGLSVNRWVLRCHLDHVDTDRKHVCAMSDSNWEDYWLMAKGQTSAHEKATMLQVKLETYREVPP
jgi:hypothetical protein